MLKVHVIIASTRPGRVGPTIGRWLHGFAERQGTLEARLVDLAEVNLPLLDEPQHARLRQYQQAHTKAWSATVAEADAYVFVTPEYNYSAPPSLLNALDYLHHEWRYKPVGFVSYGGIAGGTRAVQMLKLTVTGLGMMPLPEGVAIPFFSQHLDAGGAFQATPAHETAAATMLRELLRWAEAMKPMRGTG